MINRMLLAAGLLPASVLAAAVVGQAAPDFTARDLAGNPVHLADLKGKTVVLEWHNFGCPFVHKHYDSGHMQALQKKYASDVVWITVNSTNQKSPDYRDPPGYAAQLKQVGGAPASYVVDEPGQVGRAYGARTTPHMFIIDPKGTLVYAGAIDDKRSTNLADIPTAKNYVSTALDEMKAGKAITTASTVPYGCSVHYR